LLLVSKDVFDQVKNDAGLSSKLQIAGSYYAMNDYESASSILEEVMAQDYYNCEALNLLGKIKTENNSVNEAQQFFNRCLEKHPNNTAALFNLGETLCLEGKLNEDEKHFAKYLELEK